MTAYLKEVEMSIKHTGEERRRLAENLRDGYDVSQNANGLYMREKRGEDSQRPASPRRVYRTGARADVPQRRRRGRHQRRVLRLRVQRVRILLRPSRAELLSRLRREGGGGMITDNVRREAAELGIRAWLNSYLHEETPHGDIRMAAIAAGFGGESEALSYLQRVLLGDARPPIDRDALLELADELDEKASRILGVSRSARFSGYGPSMSEAKHDAYEWRCMAARIREALGEPTS